MNFHQTKQHLLNACKTHIADRQTRINSHIESLEESLNSETKSSAGDKHETGRAMLQLEREKAGAQLLEVEKLLAVMSAINIEPVSTAVKQGSLVFTSQGNYFIAISAGKITLGKEDYFAISSATPMGKLLLGKKVNDIFVFNNREITIQQIC